MKQNRRRRTFFTGIHDSKILNWILEVTVKILTAITLIITIFLTAEPAAQQIETTFNINIPPLTLENKIEVVIVPPDGEAIQLEINPEQMAQILAALEAN